MPNYLHPGVYVEEISGGARPIEAVGASTAAFVGVAEKGPLDEAKFITNFTEFQQIYGGYVSDGDIGKSYLAYTVYQFFQNGGSSCYVVRVEDGAKTAEADLYTGAGRVTTTIKAASPGLWGNDLKIAIGKATTSDNGFNLYVIEGDEILETFEDLSMVDKDPFFVDRVVKRSLYVAADSKDLPDNPTFTGGADLGGGVDLQNVKNINLRIDDFGPYAIDCSEGAANTAAVTAHEIRANINKAFENDIKKPVASAPDNKIVISSPTAETDSKIVLTAPTEKDATYDILGLQESSWMVAGVEETPLAQALGLSAPDAISGRSLSVALGADPDIAPYTEITIKAGDPLFTIVSTINDGLGEDVAYTDGAHLILSAAEDIRIERNTVLKRTDVNALFGSKFYSHVHVGAGDNPASIDGDADIAAGGVTGRLRLTIDAVPTFEVAFNGQSTSDNVAAAINAAWKKAGDATKTIAKTNGAKVNLASINTGSTGRIIVSSHTGADAATAVLGNAYQNEDDFLIPAVEQSVARLAGSTNFISPEIGPGLTGKKLRLSAGGEPVELTISTPQNSPVQDLFDTDFFPKTGLNHKLLAMAKNGSIHVHLIAASLSGSTELRFSIPLTAGESSVHMSDSTAETHAAYVKLFGNRDPFTENPLQSPEYTYTFGLPDNNPARTVVMSGEEMDFSRSRSLRGGDQDRTDENRLGSLTVGSAPGETTGVRLLDALTDVSILCIPGWSAMSDAIAKKLIDDGIAYCDKVRPARARPLRDLFYVANTPAGVTDPTGARDFVRKEISTSSAGGYVAIYYPWITVSDPIGTKSPTISTPPAGAVAGLYAAIDNRRGVWKAPAGTEAGLAGVVSLADQVSDVKQDILNPHGVNVIRRMPGAGVVSWGARTLATNPEWKYIPVRRMAIMMEVSIYEGIQWAVFEPNDEPLWSSLRLNINAFMTNLFANGAFQGRTPDEAFFVRCDSETTTQNDIDLGKVNIHVGFAPLKPAEFVIVKISQKAGKTE